MNEWIKCGERIPAENEVVLVYGPGFGRETAAWDRFVGWALASDIAPEEREVTHWMPLPEPPAD